MRPLPSSTASVLFGPNATADAPLLPGSVKVAMSLLLTVFHRYVRPSL